MCALYWLVAVESLNKSVGKDAGVALVGKGGNHGRCLWWFDMMPWKTSRLHHEPWRSGHPGECHAKISWSEPCSPGGEHMRVLWSGLQSQKLVFKGKENDQRYSPVLGVATQ
jgi:hypothetical protein